jgi:hypothetical protein
MSHFPSWHFVAGRRYAASSGRGSPFHSLGLMQRIVLACADLPGGSEAEVAADIAVEFREHRSWQKNVSCTWDGHRLLLQADTDNDPQGLALMDEFGDCLVAYSGAHGDIVVESIVSLQGEADRDA